MPNAFFIIFTIGYLIYTLIINHLNCFFRGHMSRLFLYVFIIKLELCKYTKIMFYGTSSSNPEGRKVRTWSAGLPFVTSDSLSKVISVPETPKARTRKALLFQKSSSPGRVFLKKCACGFSRTALRAAQKSSAQKRESHANKHIGCHSCLLA